MSDHTDAEKAFLAFDWSKSDEWQKYFEGLYPTPPATRVLHFKKKWFRANVDSNLSMDFTPDSYSSSTPSTAPTSSTTSSTSTPSYNPPSTASPTLRLTTLLLLFAGCIASVLYLIPLGFHNAFRNASLFFLIGFLLDLFSRYGRPQLNAAYWQSTLMDESGQAAFITIAGLGLRTWTALVSPVFTAIMFCAQNSSLWINRIPKSLNSRVDPLMRQVNSNRYQMMQLRSNFEVMVGFTSLFMIFVGSSSLMTTLLYWNAIRFKYQANPFTQATFRLIDNKLTGWISSPMCPRPVGTAYTFVKGHLSKMVQTQSA